MRSLSAPAWVTEVLVLLPRHFEAVVSGQVCPELLHLAIRSKLLWDHGQLVVVRVHLQTAVHVGGLP